MFLGRPYRHRKLRKTRQKVPLPLQDLLPAQEKRACRSPLMACGARGWMPPDLTVREREDAWWNCFTSSHRSFCSCDDPVGHINTLARDNSAVAQTPTTTSGQGPPPPTPPRTPGPRPGSAPGKGRIRASWTYPVAPGGPGSTPWGTGGAGDAGGAAGGGAGVLSAAGGGGDGDAGPGGAAGGGGDDVDDLLAAIEGDVGGDG